MQVCVTIEGATPLLMNRFHEGEEIKSTGGTQPAAQKDSPRDQAAVKAYSDDAGFLYIPGPNVFAALIAAGTFQKIKTSKLTSAKASLVPAGLGLAEIMCPLRNRSDEPIRHFEVDSRSVVNPSTGGRIMCHRPRVDEWRITFTLEIDLSIFNEKMVRQLVDDAGKKIGLGDYRPHRKGPFGKFVVVRWQTHKQSEAA